MRRSLALAAGATLVFSFLLSQEETSSAQSACPSCDSFGIQRVSEKKEAPFFNLKKVDGTFVNLRDLKGKPALLFFWATWCPSCKEEIGLVEKFSRGKTAQFSIFTIVIDGESEKSVQRAIQKHAIGLPVLLDVREKIARTYGVKMVPSAYLISGEGLLLGAIVGQRDWSSTEAWSAIRELFDLR